MVQLTRTDSTNPDFVELVKHLDAELEIRDGDEHPFYDQFNKIHDIKYVVLAYENGQPVSCGSIKEFSPGVMEVKRMFTLFTFRGKGIASMLLKELENWATELGYTNVSLKRALNNRKLFGFIKKTITPAFRILVSTRVLTIVFVSKNRLLNSSIYLR